MDNTIFIQIIDAKAERLLYNLEGLQLIRLLTNPVQTKQNLSEKYAGKLSSQVIDALQQYIAQSHNEWNERNI